MHPFAISSRTPSYQYSVSVPALPTLSSASLIVEGQSQIFKQGTYPKIDSAGYSEESYAITIFMCFEDKWVKMCDKDNNWLLWSIIAPNTWDSLYNWKMTFDGVTTLMFYIDDVLQPFDSMSPNPLVFNGFSEGVNIVTDIGFISFKELV